MSVRAGFEAVRDAFADVLAGSSGGASFCVYRRGEPLVRLHGNWAEDTRVVLFSGTKGIVATVVAMLTARGLLDPDEPVSRYWPEFAAAGKQDVPVSQVLAHTVGLPYVEPDLPMLDNAANAAALAGQSPLWTPGSRVAYHALTYGYLLTELVRRATGEPLGTLVRTMLAEPHGLDLRLGTPPEVPVATLRRAPGYRISTFLQDPGRRRVVERMYRGLLDSGDTMNSPEYRGAALAAGGGVGTADAMARLYDLLLSGELVPGQVLGRATRTWSEGIDAINDRPLRFGLGFELADPIGTYGPAGTAFGHSGAGGGRHGAWPEHGIAFSFTTNELQAEDVDTRASSLLAALHSCL
ncbi:serine hydrolase domain-containing protein [Amycolatopsis jiangsuensis]|uniref:CubicO group peptidase (Beta-lactamase class C family) n=1 Tax=Amycolatopsis jiangsuensis TaxID=1181879 RepID=A0A840INF0_9PSEU|nr:serine hydrolase domain-containing protein [Amycolatopsis jiangsuensis]MBB4683470.1 CubicO group peptidase (beta-lactamase class C family) [Amycolatopsis jiangsuensis]